MGLVLLINVVTVAILATPAVRYFGDDNLNVFVTYTPYVWLPAVMALLREWRRCALIKDCIAPPGSNRRNHRQDQALLSILIHRYLAGFNPPLTLEDRFLDFTAWNDRDPGLLWGRSILRWLKLD